MRDYHDIFGGLRSASFVGFDGCAKLGPEICRTLGYAVIGTKLQRTAANHLKLLAFITRRPDRLDIGLLGEISGVKAPAV